VDLLTHSRGGLVAEVLVRACASADLAADLRFFAAKGYQQHRADMEALHDALARKRIRIGRVVRVACPARGTLLASKRLDAYLSVFKWSLELAGIPVAPAVVDLIAHVAAHREDPARIPGLSAQIPDNPLVKWLYSATDPIPGDLRVVAGDIEGDSVVSWLKTLVADSFYWTDNDLVVQTRSMYGGVPRKEAATFVLDQGGKVSHFTYFTNEPSAAAITSALVDADPRRFRPIGAAVLGRRRIERRARTEATRCVSHRPAAGDRQARRLRPAGHSRQQPQSRQRPHLAFAADRLRLEQARVFARQGQRERGRAPRAVRRAREVPRENARGHRIRLRLATAAGRGGAAPCRCSRQCDRRARAQRIARTDRRAFDGRIARADDAARAAADVEADDGARWRARPHAWHAQRRIMGADASAVGRRQLRQSPRGGRRAVREPGSTHADGRVPGFIQMQAGLLDATPDLASAATWHKLAADDLEAARERSVWHDVPLQLDAYEWGIPTQDVLDRAVGLRRKLDGQLGATLAGFADRIALVVGQSKLTRTATR
jgi:hypothetical protein